MSFADNITTGPLGARLRQTTHHRSLRNPNSLLLPMDSHSDSRPRGLPNNISLQQQQHQIQNIEQKMDCMMQILNHSLGIQPLMQQQNCNIYDAKNYVPCQANWRSQSEKNSNFANQVNNMNLRLSKRINKLNELTKPILLKKNLNAIERFTLNYESYINQMDENIGGLKQYIEISPASKKLKNIFVKLFEWKLIGPFCIINTGYNEFKIKLDLNKHADEITKIKYLGNIRSNWNAIVKPRGNEQLIYCYQDNTGVNLCIDITQIPFYNQTFNEPSCCKKLFMVIKPKYYVEIN